MSNKTVVEVVITVEIRNADTDARLSYDEQSIIGRLNTLRSVNFDMGPMISWALYEAEHKLLDNEEDNDDRS